MVAGEVADLIPLRESCPFCARDRIRRKALRTTELLERLSPAAYNLRMPFPLSVADLWKMFEWANSQEAKNKRAVCEWLDAVNTDLEDLSRVWLKLCESVETSEDEKELARAMKIINRGAGTHQGAFEGRVIAFYESASRALGYKRKADFHREFIDKLLDKDFRRDSSTPQSATQRLIQMRAFAQTIQQDMASLQVLIKTFKAQD